MQTLSKLKNLSAPPSRIERPTATKFSDSVNSWGL